MKKPTKINKIKTITIFLTILFFIFSLFNLTYSQTTTIISTQYKGKIGKYPITIEYLYLKDNNKIEGKYKYDNIGKSLRLEGEIDLKTKQVTIREYDENNNNTGIFKGRLIKDDTVRLLRYIRNKDKKIFAVRVKDIKLPRKYNQTTTMRKYPKLINCDKSLDCFISASKMCNPAKVVYTPRLDMFGLKINATYILEIKGIEENKCTLYLRLEKYDLESSPDFPQEALNQQKGIYKKLEGMDGICKFNKNEDLTAMLKRWQEGIFNVSASCVLTAEGFNCKSQTEDFKNAECKGKYFEYFEKFNVEEIYGKRMPANIRTKIDKCPEGAETIPIQEDGTACFENQKDLGTIEGLIINGKPVQCCVPK